MKNRIVSITLLIVATLSFCACQPSPNITESVTVANSKTTLMACTQETSAGYYNVDMLFNSAATITYIDYAQKTQIFLCNAPSCTHDTESCISYILLDKSVAVPALFVAKDKLLLMQTGASETENPHIKSCDLNGANRKKLIEFSANCVLSPVVYCNEQFLYFFLEEIDAETTLSQKKLVQVALASGKSDYVYEYPIDVMTPALVGAVNNKLIISSYAVDSANNMCVEYHFFDLETMQLDTKAIALFDTAKSGSFVSNASLYEIQYEDCRIVKNNLLTGTSTTASYKPVFKDDINNIERQEYIFHVFDNTVRIETAMQTQAETIFKENLLNMETGEIKPFTLLKSYNKDVITVLSSHEDLLLVLIDWKKTEVLNEDGVKSFLYAPQYAFITKPNFENSIEQYIPIVTQTS